MNPYDKWSDEIQELANMARSHYFGQQSLQLLKALTELQELRLNKSIEGRSPKEARGDL